jgi:hypothetical protein
MIAKPTCLRTTTLTITAVAVPAAIGIDRSKRSIATPATIPAVASTNHFLRVVFIPIHRVPECPSSLDGSIAGARLSN